MPELIFDAFLRLWKNSSALQPPGYLPKKKAQNDRILCLFLIPVLVSEEILQKILQVNLKYVLFSIFLLWISSFTSLKKSGNVNVSSVILCPISLSITLIIAFYTNIVI